MTPSAGWVISLTALGNITQNISVSRLNPNLTVAFPSGIRLAINEKEGGRFRSRQSNAGGKS
jgi:hypothetical protein